MQMLTLVFQDHKTGNILMAYIPNENKTPYINPPKAIRELGNTLKIGTPVKISFLGSKFTGAIAEGEAPEIESFIFRGKLKKIVNEQQAFVAKVSVAKMAWAMPLENTGISTEEKKGKYPPPAPDEALLAKLDKFKNSDIVEVEYKIQDFNYFLTDIRPHTLNIIGKLVSKQKKAFEGKMHEFAVIRDRRGNMYTMRVPYEDTQGEKGVSESLSGLVVGKTVQATGRKFGGVCHLDGIAEGAELPVTPKKPQPGNRPKVPVLLR